MFRIKRGDTSPTFEKRLVTVDGEPVDITNWNKVEFHARDENYNNIIADDTLGGVAVLDAGAGKVKYEWQDGDTSDVGLLFGEFVVTFSTGRVQSFPRRGHYSIDVTSDIDD